jgi:hypothetical protein
MRLHFKGSTPLSDHYRYFWGFYVRGFKPWVHCQPCLRGTRADGINLKMAEVDVDLLRPTDFFYLHGNASGKDSLRGVRNIHLAVRPKEGFTATVTSYYGHVFTIEGAEEIVIQEPILTLPELEDHWTRCKNFRFGAQVYDAPILGPTAPHTPITRMREV